MWEGSEGSRAAVSRKFSYLLPGEADGLVLEKGFLEPLAAMEAAVLCVPPSSELHQADQGSCPVATEIHCEFQICLWVQERLIN